MQRMLTDFWVSFATNEVSNISGVQWPRLNPNEKLFHYLYIAGSDKIQMGRSINFDQKDFWNSVNFNENKLYTASDILREEL
ncbi:venom carboxylesterase-6-like [Bombus impatiens]|uniref:Venom carboxylesterase-6-like n=1 Tax=Bombus impatiens TaxID=132113 RepID=A0A6P8LAF2_BOMIM|nr:venom carboxylesterase-6-like [Bombus impatiens]